VEGNSKPDYGAAEELKQKIENSTNGRIEVRLLDEPAITDDKKAILRGKKAGSHIVIYGTQMQEFGHLGDTVKFFIVPINLKGTPLESEVFNLSDEKSLIQNFLLLPLPFQFLTPP